MNVKINEPNKRLFVGPILKQKGEEEIRDAFSAVVDGIVNVEVQEPADPHSNAKNKGFCFLDFVDHKTAAHVSESVLMINCSNEVCSNYISPVGLFYAIFRLTDLSSDAYDFSSSKTG